ncbi:putative amidoligase domain-containing protein [Heliophilum fasciatum]|uniref:PhiEco32-like amidoligase-type 2 protein n=1 Tax=Heliophilum fasciatum TaxID=35700 RepID=A0A4V2SY32_9FIRM|nr:hypothetical protein [Heliophilum fasciatum]MCW2277018.1 hypothetical protein [Heliophilum fasciatum]TCP68456.1 phiEco32-like amidoligase-type 2 protein [Heliophilum fasciatum]
MDTILLHAHRRSGQRLADALGCPHMTSVPSETPDTLICFGRTAEAQGRLLTLNPVSVLQDFTQQQALRLYRIHNVPFDHRGSDRRVLTVHIVDGRIIAVQTRNTLTASERKKALGTAMRALYLSGADFGAVKVAVPVRGYPRLLSIHLAPNLTPRLARIYAPALRELIVERLTPSPAPENLLLGADPEFMLQHRRTGKMIAARRHFTPQGSIGCDQRSVIGEVRPQPQKSPRELTDTIRRLLLRVHRRIARYPLRLVAGSQPFPQFPIGGHIHFGNVPLRFRFLRALDHYLLIPLFLIECTATAKQRRRYYGGIGDVRVKSSIHFEYRSPASWLINPEITLATFTLAQLIATHFHNLPATFLHNPAIARQLYLGNKTYFREQWPGLRQSLEALPSYSTCTADLQPLWQMIDEGREWDEKRDIRDAWGI